MSAPTVHIQRAATGWCWAVVWRFRVVDGKAWTRGGAHRAAWRAAMKMMAEAPPPK